MAQVSAVSREAACFFNCRDTDLVITGMAGLCRLAVKQGRKWRGNGRQLQPVAFPVFQ